MSGTTLFQDGSRHAGPPRGPELDPIAIVDDATGRIPSIVPVGEEGTASSFRGVKEVTARHGLFLA